MIDPAFDCNVNRTNGDPTTQLYLINHFLDKPVSIIADGVVPDKDRLNQTNAAEGFGSLGLHAEQCGAQHGRSPNFLLVDVSVFFLISIRSLLPFSYVTSLIICTYRRSSTNTAAVRFFKSLQI